jgi:plastocyanin domain-containing protein
MPTELVLGGVATAVALVVSALAYGHVRGAARGQIRRIRVNGGYLPSEVHVIAGEPTRLIFRREETAFCSERVVFPDFGISVTLPPFQDVAVDLPASTPGTHAFTCQRQMLHGKLVIDDADRTRRYQQHAPAR